MVIRIVFNIIYNSLYIFLNWNMFWLVILFKLMLFVYLIFISLFNMVGLNISNLN